MSTMVKYFLIAFYTCLIWVLSLGEGSSYPFIIRIEIYIFRMINYIYKTKYDEVTAYRFLLGAVKVVLAVLHGKGQLFGRVGHGSSGLSVKDIAEVRHTSDLSKYETRGSGVCHTKKSCQWDRPSYMSRKQPELSLLHVAKVHVTQTTRAVSVTCGKGSCRANNQGCLCYVWQRFMSRKQPGLSLRRVAKVHVAQTTRAVSATCGKGPRRANNQGCLCDVWQRYTSRKQPGLSLRRVAKVHVAQTTRAVSATCGKGTRRANNQGCLGDVWQRYTSRKQPGLSRRRVAKVHVAQTTRAVSATCGKGPRRANNQGCLCDMWQRYTSHKQPELSRRHVAKVHVAQTTRAVSATCGKGSRHTNSQNYTASGFQGSMLVFMPYDTIFYIKTLTILKRLCKDSTPVIKYHKGSITIKDKQIIRQPQRFFYETNLSKL